MYKDIIQYELTENTTKTQLLTIAQRIINTGMKNQEGFVKWEIHTNCDGTYTDIVHWKSKEAAKNAEKEMINIPNAADWFACYKEGSVTSKNISTIAEF